jgi:hypothetical protein
VRRIFWLALGLGAGATAAVTVARWVRQQTERMAPANIGRQAGQVLSDVGGLVGQALAEFRSGMAEKESEIRASLVR